MGDLHVPKKIDKSVMWEFVTNNQNFDRPYIARYKNSSQVFFLSMQGDCDESNKFLIYTCLIKIIEFCGYHSFHN